MIFPAQTVTASFSPDARSLAAEAIVRTLQAKHFAAAFVGGAVRDLVAGGRADDIDLVTTARPEALKALFPAMKTVGAGFGVHLIEMDGFSFEVATAREERNYLDGRHPALIRYADDLATDAVRRDFTVNALLFDPLRHEIIDYVGGLVDLRRGVIRTVGDPRRRFGEDYLRMLRAVRFAARMNFTIEPATAAAIVELAPKTALLSPERIRMEFSAMLTGPAPERAIRLCDELGLLPVLLPAVAALKGVEQPPDFHPEGDVFEHTMGMLAHLRLASAELAWSVLLHDIGKPATRFVDAANRIRFFGHECRGAELAAEVLNQLRFSTAEQDAIVTAIRNHMNFAQVEQMKPITRRKMLGGPGFALELELNRLDCISCHRNLAAWLLLLDDVIGLEGKTELPPPLLHGRDLIAAGFAPGPKFGKVLKEVYELQLSGQLPDRDAALGVAAARLRRQS